MVTREFNTDLAKLERTTCTDEITTALAATDLEDMISHFLPR